jgi:hypothetical protein
MLSNSHLGAASSPRSLGVTQRQKLHVWVSFQLRRARTDCQPGLAMTVEKQVQFSVPRKATNVAYESLRRVIRVTSQEFGYCIGCLLLFA